MKKNYDSGVVTQQTFSLQNLNISIRYYAPNIFPLRVKENLRKMTITSIYYTFTLHTYSNKVHIHSLYIYIYFPSVSNDCRW